MKRLLVLLPLASAALALACGGSASEPALTVDPIDECTGSACEKGSKDGGASSRNKTGSKESGENGSSTSEDGDGTGSGTGTGTGTGTGSTTSDAGTTSAPENTCETATSLGQMAGERKRPWDSAIESFSAQGSCSKWFKIRVVEASNHWDELGLKATLISPNSKKFELYTYVNKNLDVPECVATEGDRSTASKIDTVDLKWYDSWSSDDSRTVSIEVRAKNGCDPSATWSLLVESREFGW